MNIHINLTQFYINFFETGTLDRFLICIIQRLRLSGFSLYNPLSFFLYSLFQLDREEKQLVLCLYSGIPHFSKYNSMK